jgi:hypothetical protein
MDYDLRDMTAVISGILGSPLSHEMSFRLEGALEVTDGLWDLVPVVVAAGEQHDQRSPAEAADASPAGLRLTPDSRARVRTAYDLLLATQGEVQNGQQFDESVVSGLTLREVMADPFGLLARMMNIPEQAEVVAKAMGNLATLTGDEVLYLHAYARASDQTGRTPMLLRALFITAVGTIEPLVTRLVTLLLYHAIPQRYASLADPELDKKARKLCHGNPETWRKVLGDLGVPSMDTVIDWKRLSDLWEERNVVVHRGSVTDAPHHAKTGTEVGTVISPDAAVVQSVIDVVGGTRYALVACVWEHLAPGAGHLAEVAGGHQLESLRARRWEQAKVLGLLQEHLSAGLEDQATARVNRWLASEMGHGHEAIRSEVEAWDTSGLPPEYGLARLVLLREDEQALALLDSLLAAGKVTQADVDSWPLFDRLRDQGVLPGS